MVQAKNTIGRALRGCREEAGLRQDELAKRARERGLSWTSATVAAIELGRREVSLEEFLVLRGSPLSAGELTNRGLFGAWSPKRRISGRAAAKVSAGLDAEIKAARKLKVSPDVIVSTALRLWGRSLTD